MATIQILHYEFMGPIQLGEWGPPMKDVVYALLARDGDKFSMVYVDHCDESDDVGFFTKNPRFKCWMSYAGSERNLYVAVYLMPGSSESERAFAVGKIVSKYAPPCNAEPVPEDHTAGQSTKEADCGDTVACACCGGRMHLERELPQSNLYRCDGCGISDTRLK